MAVAGGSPDVRGEDGDAGGRQQLVVGVEAGSLLCLGSPVQVDERRGRSRREWRRRVEPALEGQTVVGLESFERRRDQPVPAERGCGEGRPGLRSAPPARRGGRADAGSPPRGRPGSRPGSGPRRRRRSRAPWPPGAGHGPTARSAVPPRCGHRRSRRGGGSGRPGRRRPARARRRLRWAIAPTCPRRPSEPMGTATRPGRPSPASVTR